MNQSNLALVPDHQRLQVTLRCTSQQVGRWTSKRWEIASIVPADAQGDHVNGDWTGELALNLYRDEVNDYRLNLNSGRPRLFVVCSRDGAEDRLIPRMLTISQGAAEAHLETEDEVLSSDLPGDLRDWIAAYTVLVPINPEAQRRKGKKRRRV